LSHQLEQKELLNMIRQHYKKRIEFSTMSLQSITKILELVEELDKSLRHSESLNREQCLILEALLAQGA
jgi:hypothetical protein